MTNFVWPFYLHFADVYSSRPELCRNSTGQKFGNITNF